jgi:hypothetical protein
MCGRGRRCLLGTVKSNSDNHSPKSTRTETEQQMRMDVPSPKRSTFSDKWRSDKRSGLSSQTL